MADLRTRFGKLVAAHRRRKKLTQEELADAADISVDMVSKIESGASGARFPVIGRIAAALEVDPAELFSTEIPGGALQRGPIVALSAKLLTLRPDDLVWIENVLDAILTPSSRAERTSAVRSAMAPRKPGSERPKARSARRR